MIIAFLLRSAWNSNRNLIRILQHIPPRSSEWYQPIWHDGEQKREERNMRVKRWNKLTTSRLMLSNWRACYWASSITFSNFINLSMFFLGIRGINGVLGLGLDGLCAQTLKLMSITPYVCYLLLHGHGRYPKTIDSLCWKKLRPPLRTPRHTTTFMYFFFQLALHFSMMLWKDNLFHLYYSLFFTSHYTIRSKWLLIDLKAYPYSLGSVLFIQTPVLIIFAPPTSMTTPDDRDPDPESRWLVGVIATIKPGADCPTLPFHASTCYHQ